MKFFIILSALLIVNGVSAGVNITLAPQTTAQPVAAAPKQNVTVKPVTVIASTTTPTTTPTTPATTTTIKPEPKVKVLESNLCKRCHCEIKTKTLECSNENFSVFFTKDELNILLHGDVEFETIRLDHNNIQVISAFPALPVKRLHLNNNKIDRIENSAFKELIKLEYLDLSHNHLTSKALVPAVFEGRYDPSLYEPLAHLKELNLGYNQLHTIDEDIFEHFPKLENLILGSNQFHVIDRRTEVAISSLLNLKTLDLSYMQLSDLPPYLLHSPRGLENLILTGNLFTLIPDALTYAINLKKLNLDENIFAEIDGKNVFPRLTKLEELSLSYMSELTRIGKGAFSGLESLKELMATNNPLLSSIHPSAFSRAANTTETILEYPPIEKLFLHNNNLSTLDKSLLERWDKVLTVDIRVNPWKCDCDNSWLIHTLYPQIVQNSPVLSHNIECASPPEWKDVAIHELHDKKKNLRCSDAYGNNPSRDGAVLLGILIGLLVGIPLTFVLIFMYRRGCFGLIGNPGPADYSRAFYKRANFGEDL